MNSFFVNEPLRKQFDRDGYFLVDRLLDSEEIDLLRNIARADKQLDRTAANRRDGQGGVVKLSLSNDLADDIYGAVVRSRRIVDAMEQLLGGEVYHYHHKMILKEPLVGGAWEWHQDYGYWYHNGCLFPHLASCMIALDRATRENGCLQVLKGSHHLGRIDHGKVGDQTGADLEHVLAACQRLELVPCELQPGSAIFFHCNLLHRSDQNRSPAPRWAFICCYNAARNDPYKESRHPRYSRLDKWPDEKVKEVGRRQWATLQTTMTTEVQSMSLSNEQPDVVGPDQAPAMETMPGWDDPVLAAFRKDIDRTLLRENLKLTVDQRFEKFESFMEYVHELREAGRRSRSLS